MSSTTPVTPSTPAATPSILPAFLQHWITFVKAHEKLLIIGFAGFLLFHFYSKVIDAWVNHDKLAQSVAAQKVTADNTETTALRTEVADLKAQLVAQNAQILAQIANQKVVTQKQQQVDATLSPIDLSARLAKLVNVPQAEITPATLPDKVEFTNEAAVATAQQLETIPELQSEVSSLNTIIANDNTIISKQGDLITQLNKNLADEKVSHVDDVKELKAQNHKSWLNGFKWGVITGFTLGLVAHNAGA